MDVLAKSQQRPACPVADGALLCPVGYRFELSSHHPYGPINESAHRVTAGSTLVMALHY